jgi:hypothetical protein
VITFYWWYDASRREKKNLLKKKDVLGCVEVGRMDLVWNQTWLRILLDFKPETSGLQM